MPAAGVGEAAVVGADEVGAVRGPLPDLPPLIAAYEPARGEQVWVVGRRRVWAGRSRRPWLVANRATLTQK